MKYGLNLAADGRVLSATFARFATEGYALVEELPPGDISEYIYVDGKLEYKPIISEKVEETPNRLDMIEAQLVYTAMMTDTLLEV